MADLFDNPMGLMGFEFVEFASPVPGVLEPVFERMGFSHVANHRSKDVALYRQGDINFIVNREPKSAAHYFAAEHGPSACGMAFRVKDSHRAYARASSARSRWTCPRARWSCACRRFAVSVGHRCT
jgi:4-hydroxyphenylpyruvate dioxygenase